MSTNPAPSDACDSNQQYKEYFDYLTSGIYPESCDVPAGYLRTSRRKNFRKRVIAYTISSDKTDLFYTRKLKKDKNSTEQVTVKIVIDVDRRHGIIKNIHEGPGDTEDSKALGGHLGRDKTLAKIAERYYWPNFSADVREFCRTCKECKMVKARFKKGNPELKPVSVPQVPWEQIGVDVCSLPKTSDGYVCFIVAVDYFSKYVVSEALKSKTAADIALFLYNLQSQYGAAAVHINDQGGDFVNDVATEIHTLSGTRQRITSAYHPQTNGLAERNNRTIQSMLLKSLQSQHLDWQRALAGIISSYNTSKQKSTKISPFELMFSRRARLFTDQELDDAEPLHLDQDLAPIIDDVDIDQFHRTMERNKQVQDLVYKAQDVAIASKKVPDKTSSATTDVDTAAVGQTATSRPKRKCKKAGQDLPPTKRKRPAAAFSASNKDPL